MKFRAVLFTASNGNWNKAGSGGVCESFLPRSDIYCVSVRILLKREVGVERT